MFTNILFDLMLFNTYIGAGGKKDSAKAATNSASLLSPIPTKGAPTSSKVGNNNAAAKKVILPANAVTPKLTSTGKTDATTTITTTAKKSMIPKKRKKGEQDIPKKVDDMPNAAPEVDMDGASYVEC